MRESKMRVALLFDRRKKWLPRRWFMRQQSFGYGGGGDGGDGLAATSWSGCWLTALKEQMRDINS